MAQQPDLLPGDVLLFPVRGWGILNPLMRLLLSWGHVAIYYTETKRGLPLVVESMGRGVMIRSLLCHQGATIKIMRPVDDAGIGERAAKAAERIADNRHSWYGYWDIPRFVVPKLLLARLGAWLPGRLKLGLWILAHTYRRNSVYICSELVSQAYRDAQYPLVAEDTIPLPDDLARSDKLREVGDLEIKEEPCLLQASYS